MSRQRRRRIVENYLIIWVDENIDIGNEDYQHALAQLRAIVNEVNPCTTAEQCVEKLQKNNEETSFVISSGALGQHLVPDIHDMPKLNAIYILCRNKQRHEIWAKNWAKIKGVHTSIKSICQALQIAVKQCDQHTTTVSIIGVNEGSSSENFNQLEASFMYTQIFKEILIDMEHSQQTIRDLIKFCQEEYIGNIQEIKLIDEFRRTYHSSKAIWWYTRQCFAYKMLNHALRTLDGDISIRMGFFACDVHRQIESLHEKQLNQYYGKLFLVYRGQGLSTLDFEKLVKNKGGLISFHTFLSTTKNRDVSLAFAKDALRTTDMIGILFQMSIDPTVSSTPFAFVREESYYKEEDEILFSMNTVFRIGDIRTLDKNRLLYEVDLRLTSYDDQQLRQLTERIQEEIDATGWYRLGKLLFKLGLFHKAEEFYITLLEQTSDDSHKVYIYQQLGEANQEQGQYKEAVSFLEKSIKIDRKILPEDHPSLASSYNSIGLLYNSMGNYLKALEFYEKALKIREKALPSNHPDLADSYTNIGHVYNSMGDYSKVLELHKKAIKIREKVLPPNHLDLADSYNNMGLVYNNIMGDYLKALEFYEKAHKIKKKVLPHTHPDLATSYNHIGLVYNNMGDYRKALEFYEKALKIRDKALPPNHPSLAGSHLNFAVCYERMGDYAEALNALKNAFQIQQKTFQEGNPNFALTYSWLGRVHRSMKDYSKALENFEKCLAIFQQTLPERHPHQAITYSNIGDVHQLLGDYEMSLSFHRKALDIQENVQCNPLECATTYINLGETYREMKDYPTALTYFQKGLEIRQNNLPKNHPDLAIIYHNLAKVYLATRQYSMTMKNVEQAVEIAQEKLPSNHPHLLDYKETFEKIQKKL